MSLPIGCKGTVNMSECEDGTTLSNMERPMPRNCYRAENVKKMHHTCCYKCIQYIFCDKLYTANKMLCLVLNTIKSGAKV